MPRKRRTAEEAKAEILEAAESRLRDHGLDGLTVVEVAKACDMSHATVIHHFGSTEEMRRALVNRMTGRLLRDVLATMSTKPAPTAPQMLNDLFTTLSRGGHAKLLAWLTVGGEDFGGNARPREKHGELFQELVPMVAQLLPDAEDPHATARQLIYLVATAAIGYGVAGDILPMVVGMSEDEAAAFPEWLGRLIGQLIVQSK